MNSKLRFSVVFSRSSLSLMSSIVIVINVIRSSCHSRYPVIHVIHFIVSCYRFHHVIHFILLFISSRHLSNDVTTSTHRSYHSCHSCYSCDNVKDLSFMLLFHSSHVMIVMLWLEIIAALLGISPLISSLCPYGPSCQPPWASLL
jgi:hypothetical protein